MRGRILSLAVLAILATQATAREIPAAGRKDTRMRTVIYDPSQVVRLSTAVGSALVVSFSADEKVTAVAVTDSKDLVANPRDNFLFMKSKIALPPQPIIVLTSGPKGVRRYVFEVETTAAPGATDVYYSVEFVYPGDRAAMRAAAAAGRYAAEQRRTVNRELSNSTVAGTAPAPFSGAANWRYIGRGSHALMPIEVFDNGYSTAFRFPGNMRIPAIFRINPDGKEATVSYAVKGEYVVVGAVAPGWRLRDGNTVLCVWNRAYDKIGQSPGTNTTSPRVRRTVRDSSK